MKVPQLLKRLVPQPLRPPLRKCFQLLTGESSYRARMNSELQYYSGVEHVHDLPRIFHYWLDKHLTPMIEPIGFSGAIPMFRTYAFRMCHRLPDETVYIASVGAGDSATEINLAEWLRERGIRNYSFECFDINAGVLKRAEQSAREKGLDGHFRFAEFDINRWAPARQYHVVLAVQSLHHFMQLEMLFDKIRRALRPDGFFLIDDMIGRNGHQRWPEALEIVKNLWSELPDSYKYNHLLKRHEAEYENWDCSREGFEGIRSQDILPLLVERFHFDFFIAFGNLIDIFVDRCFGPNFDPDREWDRQFIDRVHALDVAEIESGRITPTHIVAAMTREGMGATTMYKHLSPQFCVRPPNRGVAGQPQHANGSWLRGSRIS